MNGFFLEERQQNFRFDVHQPEDSVKTVMTRHLLRAEQNRCSYFLRRGASDASESRLASMRKRPSGDVMGQSPRHGVTDSGRGQFKTASKLQCGQGHTDAVVPSAAVRD